jgi:hypothetical protein
MAKSTHIDLFGSLPYVEPEFRFAWTEWVEYRKQRGRPYKTQMGVNKQLNMFTRANLTVSQAIECIEHAITTEWAAIFPLKFYKNGVLSRPTIGSSLTATDDAFANLQRNIDQAVRSRWGENRVD